MRPESENALGIAADNGYESWFSDKAVHHDDERKKSHYRSYLAAGCIFSLLLVADASFFWTVALWWTLSSKSLRKCIILHFVSGNKVFGFKLLKENGNDFPRFCTDGEDVEWLNQLLQSLYNRRLHLIPLLEAQRLLEKCIRKTRHAVPSFLLRMNPFGYPRLETVEFSSECPQVKEVQSYGTDTRSKAKFGSKLLVEFSFHLPLMKKLTFSINNSLKFGVRNLKLSGAARITTISTVVNNEIVADVRARFLRCPRLEFYFTGWLRFLNDLFFIRKIIYSIMVSPVLHLVVFPRQIVFPVTLLKLSSSQRLTGWKPAIKPLGSLQFRIVSASHIREDDRKLLWVCSRRRNPYCVVTFGSRQVRTNVHFKSSVCKWNFDCHFPVTSTDLGKELEVRLMSNNQHIQWMKKDEMLGFLTLDVRSMVADVDFSEWYHLAGAGENARVLISTRFSPTVGEHMANHPLKDCPAILVFTLVKVTVSRASRLRVSARVTGDATTLKSNRGNQSTSWTFDEEFIFDVRNILTDKLELKLFDCEMKGFYKLRGKLVKAMEVSRLVSEKVLSMDLFNGLVRTMKFDVRDGVRSELTFRGRIHYVGGK